VATYYVAPGGSDSNNGTTLSTAWATIQHAADTVPPGATVMVEGGSYAENDVITRSGTASQPITFSGASGADVQVLGFQISASYVVVEGFDISSQVAGDSNPAGYGVYLNGSASYDTIANNDIHDLCEEGIFMEASVANNQILNNTINHAEMAGINIDGTANVVEGNDVSHTSQYPANDGGIFAVCSARNGADADWIRFFGQGHLIQNNNLHDIVEPSAENINPHTDCFQTWGESTATVDNIVINANYCRGESWYNSGGGTNHMGSIQDLDGPIGTIYFTNNIFADLYQGLLITINDPSHGPRNVYGNTVDHIGQEVLDYSGGATTSDIIANNIFYDSGDGGDSFTTSTAPQFSANDCIMRSGSACGTYPAAPPAGTLVENPQFVNSGDSTGSGADYQLQAASPMIGAGIPTTTLPDGTVDYAGNARPQNGQWDIGAYEYLN